MFDRLLLLTIVSLFVAPSNVAAQIVIESADGRQVDDEDEADESADEADEDANDTVQSDEETAASEREDAADRRSDDSGLTIEAYGGEEDPGPSSDDSGTTTPPENLLEEDAVRAAVRQAVRARLSSCVGATPRPAESGLRGAFVATRDDGSMVAAPAGIRYSDAMFLSDEEAGFPASKRKSLTSGRRAKFDACLGSIPVPLDGSSPLRKLTLRFAMVWFNEAALLRDVEWSSEES
jgi:hypothetical protein